MNTKLIKQYKDVENAYLQKFGANSLDRVILGDPLQGCKNTFAVIKQLETAIQTNVPLVQVPLEIWKDVIF
ncbi:MAG: hypothetical protein LKF40_03020 [Megasphaera sp.]|jgi:hypothetical protein|nr:hypothetical protein [Megasphaera sp.]